ncbi:xylulokinase, putative [Leishmania donovani]|nr:xylulokinase, putative [Leishmania donovani]CBZ38466.1 xylulokinase, putative [Leishmania donovani]
MYAGIDIGTSGIKIALMRSDGRIADSASAPLTVSSPHPLWNE